MIASGSETALPCHFRDVTDVITDMNEVIHSDAMAWFEPDSGIVKNDIVKINGTHYLVERVIQARRLRSTAVQFIKTELRVYGTIS
jgi:hypothetical protein